jgi:hypothetical protein
MCRPERGGRGRKVLYLEFECILEQLPARRMIALLLMVYHTQDRRYSIHASGHRRNTPCLS